MQGGVEHPKWGTPGVCNFIDGRTQWMDQAVESAVQEGIKQIAIISYHSLCKSNYIQTIMIRGVHNYQKYKCNVV